MIDATCTWVLQSQKAARELDEAGYTVCIIGHEDHPEVKGVRSYAGEKHVVVDDMDRSTWERVPHTKKIGVLSQSTILPFKLEEFAAFCLRRCHDLRVVNTVCPVTLTRQADSVVLAGEVDGMLVVGGKNSSNTKELAVKCADACADTLHIADADELEAEHRDWATRQGPDRDHRRHLHARGRPRGGPRPDLRADRVTARSRSGSSAARRESSTAASRSRSIVNPRCSLRRWRSCAPRRPRDAARRGRGPGPRARSRP